MTDWAAALTYYGLLALFPALIALVSVVGLFGDPAGDDEKADRHRHRDRAQHRGGHLRRTRSESITSNRGAAGVLFFVGLGGRAVVGLGLRRRVHARRRTSIYETPEGRPFWKLRPLQIARHARDGRCCSRCWRCRSC